MMKVLKDQQIQSTDNIVNQNEDNIIGYFSVLNERMQKSWTKDDWHNKIRTYVIHLSNFKIPLG